MAIDLVNRVRRSVAEHARAALSTLLAGCRARVQILPASPYDRLPDSLEEVLRSRPLTYAADRLTRFTRSIATPMSSSIAS
ncbi:MAG: hypothetical protein F4Z60_08315 [Chloroflexi bacterium]|nr:hypothetical protein [Chloroflexota bacterium]